MKKLAFILGIPAVLCLSAHARVTLEQCLDMAAENYPLIEKYGLVEKTADLELSDINKGWLPRIGIYGQVTAQNEVPEFPATLRDVLTQMGQESRGIGCVQYKAGVDMSQTIWDGGASKAQRNIERATLSEQQASLDVQMYAIRERVMDLFFGILLVDVQIEQTINTISLLKANQELMESMVSGGVAIQCDVDMIEAQILTMNQKLTDAASAAKAYREMLSVYTGENLADRQLVRPEASMPQDMASARPELKLLDARDRLNASRDNAIKCSIMPRIDLFAQAYYGYPGLDYFESMSSRNMSFNIIGGIKISWNIDGFYTLKNSHRKLAIAGESVANDRDMFLFNTRLQTDARTQEIEGLRTVMADDEKIVALRSSVRRAAELQLRNGVIDASTLLSKITDENQAHLTASYHEILLLKNIYKLKHILNR